MLRHRIDTHSHYLPDFYRTALQDNGHEKPDGMPRVPDVSMACVSICYIREELG